MFSITKNWTAYAESDKNAIILCDNKNVLRCQTYRETILLAERITEVFTKFLAQQNICLGLLMDHNVYIPSIILSLLKLKHAFMFLTTNNLDKAIADIKFNWILSLNDSSEIKSYRQIHKIPLYDDNLILWRKDLLVSNDSYENVFCVVQTSGSTGESKKVNVRRTCIETNVSALRALFDINFKDIIFWGTPLTFDPSLVELLLSLQTGASLLIVPYNIFLNPYSLHTALFNVGKITVLQTVPSVFLRWHESEIKDILSNSQLRILAFGGETFPRCILKYERRNDLKIFNLYGITEVSCWATACEITDQTCDNQIPVGPSLEETILELRDEEGKVVNSGEGEIFIGSSTRICFLNNEKPKDICGPVFRETGDLAKINENGIFLIGRKNKVIKRFGHRINLSKMESSIFKNTELENKCIWSSEKNKISTFILIKNLDVTVKKKTLDKLRVKLISILPEESFPDFIEIVENFPLTSHGKVDERALERLYYMPKNDLDPENTFSNLWCRYIGVNIDNLKEIKAHTFFEMGGNSISALQFIKEFEEVSNTECSGEIYKNIFECSLEDCLNCLRIHKFTRKRSSEEINDHVKKKGKMIENGLKVLWFYDLKACVDGSPLIFENKSSIYVSVGSFSHIFTVLNEKGECVYKVILPDSIESTPTISPCGNFILVGCFNGIMYCIDFIKREIIWEYTTDGKIKSSACCCRDQTAVVFGSYDKKLHCISAKDGLPLWKTPLNGSIASNPIYHTTLKKIFTATTAGICFCLGEDSGEILWKYACGGPVFGTPCFVNSQQGIIFPAVQSVLHCLSTNGDLSWKFQANGYIFSSVVSYKDHLVFGCHDKSIYVGKVSLSGCDDFNQIVLESEISSTPHVCDINGKRTIVGGCNSGIIYVIDFETCNVMTSLQLPGEVFSSPTVRDSKIYVGCRDNKLYCIEIDYLK